MNRLAAMKKLLFFLSALISLAFLSTSCEKEVGPLPEATQKGANTYGCYVDGQPWLPRDRDFKSSHLNFQFSPAGGVYIYALHDDVPGETTATRIILDFDALRRAAPGTYYTDSTNVCTYMVSHLIPNADSMGVEEVYTTDAQHRGRITFTRFDPVTRIMSGTFEFEAQSDGGSKLVKITDGRFDGVYVD